MANVRDGQTYSLTTFTDGYIQPKRIMHTPYNPLTSSTTFLSTIIPTTVDQWRDTLLMRSDRLHTFSQYVYAHVFILSCVNIAFMLMLNLCIDINYLTTLDNTTRPNTAVYLAFTTISAIAQIVLIVISHIGMINQMKMLFTSPTNVAFLYMTVILSYAVLYYTFFTYNRFSFNVDGYAFNAVDDNNYSSKLLDNDVKNTNNIISVFIYFVYFSCTIQTSTGFGDIQPIEWYSEAATNSQMVVGMIYHVGVFGLTLTYFITFEQKVNAIARTSHTDDADTSADAAGTTTSIHPVVDNIMRHRIVQHFSYIVHHYLLVLSISVQLISLLLISTLQDPFSTYSAPFSTGKIVVLVFCGILVTAQLCIVLTASLRVANNVQSNTITLSFLTQSYLSTALLYGLYYLFLFSCTPSHEFSRTADFPVDVFNVFVAFIYFSVTVLTGTGFGDIYARGLLARVAVCSEMIVSIVYGFIIVGLGMSQIISKMDEQAANKMVLEKMKRQAGQQPSTVA